jgi:hypothetical protein
MKQLALFTLLLLQIFVAKAQNIFPTSGYAGIGTTSPTAPLEVTVGSIWTTAFWRKSIKLNDGNSIQFTGGTKKFGIGGTSPNGLYFFATDAEDASQPAEYKMVIREDGRVGIGTITPQAMLDVDGTFRLGVNGGYGGEAYCLVLTRSGNAQLAGSNAGGLLLGGDPTGVDMAILPNGNVGIGTVSPQSKLAVNGEVFAKKVKVTLTGWPDYVFHKSYQLPSLQEIENYIIQHNHLPGIPDAKEIATKGLDIGEMNKQLLKKIEELTLYMIEMNKQNQVLANEVKALKEKIKD